MVAVGVCASVAAINVAQIKRVFERCILVKKMSVEGEE